MTYFDHNATTPLDPVVAQTMAGLLHSDWANPSAPYGASAVIRAKIERARQEVADLFSVPLSRILFTSGATEANNTYLAHQFQSISSDKRILISPFEHPSVQETAEHWFNRRVDYMPVGQNGNVLPEGVEHMMAKHNYGLVCLMAANNETGVLQPWKQVSELCQAKRIPFFCDATQWIGKAEPQHLHQCSAFSFSGHKFGGPKGIGVLVSDQSVSPLLHGGTQEKNQRGGTENFANIEGLRVACQTCLQGNQDLISREAWRDQFEEKLSIAVPGLRIVGKESSRLWNTSLLVMPKANNLSWVEKLDRLGYQVSTGAACSLNKLGERKGLSVLGLNAMEVRKLIRVSAFWSTEESDWLGLAHAFSRAYRELEQDAGQSGVISI